MIQFHIIEVIHVLMVDNSINMQVMITLYLDMVNVHNIFISTQTVLSCNVTCTLIKNTACYRNNQNMDLLFVIVIVDNPIQFGYKTHFIQTNVILLVVQINVRHTKKSTEIC